MIETIINFLTSYLKQVGQGLLQSLGLVTVVYVIVWVILSKPLRSRKIQTTKRAGFKQISNEVYNALWVTASASIFTMGILWLKDSGFTKFYLEVGKYGWWYEIFTAVLVLLVSDTWFYWVHRTLHHPKIYKYIHAEHHKSEDTTPFTTFSFHVIESVSLTLGTFPLLIFMPISLLSLGIAQFIGLFNNLKSHLGYELYPKFFANVFPFNQLVTSTNHNLHHSRYNGNYALMIRFWDQVCGTEIKETQEIFKSIHNRDSKNLKIIDNSEYQSLSISKIEKETPDTVSIYFEPTNQDFYNYFAGQYLNIEVTIDGKKYERSFSLSSSPLDKHLRITVKLNGSVSHWFYNKAIIGDRVNALLPSGDFFIKPEKNVKKSYLMVAGGSGITPLYSMIKTLVVDEPLSDIVLLYSNKSETLTIFDKELNALEIKYPKFKIVNFVSGQNRLSQNDINLALQNKTNIECYVCGPQSLKDSAIKYLFIASVNEDNIHHEDYVDGYVRWFGIGLHS